MTNDNNRDLNIFRLQPTRLQLKLTALKVKLASH